MRAPADSVGPKVMRPKIMRGLRDCIAIFMIAEVVWKACLRLFSQRI